MENVYIQSTIGQVYNFDFSGADLSSETRRNHLVDMIGKIRVQLAAQATLEAPFENAKAEVEKAEAEAQSAKPDATSIAAHLKMAGESLGGVTKFTAAAKGLVEELVDAGRYLQTLVT